MFLTLFELIKIKMDTEHSAATMEKVLSAKAYIEQKFLRLREEKQRKKEE